jgi:hypothetical protein
MTQLLIQTSAETYGNIQAGSFRFINRLSNLLTAQGWSVSNRTKRRIDPLLDRIDRAYHLHEITGARGPRGLNFRRAYFYPWWMFDFPQQRYGGRIGDLSYVADAIDGTVARAFYADLQRHYLVGWGRGDPDGPALVPMQAELCRQRDWQFTDLAGLVSHIRAQDPTREVLLKTHPKLTYSDSDTALLRQLCTLQNVSLATGNMASLLGRAAYVATHNSAAAFEAMVLGIPSILFARTDFHHICPQVKQPGDAPAAFAQLRGPKPDFARYLYWFLELNCLHAGREDAEKRIAELLNTCGWPVAPILDL